MLSRKIGVLRLSPSSVDYIRRDFTRMVNISLKYKAGVKDERSMNVN